MSYEHQLVTSTYLPSGVVATYFGTDPTGITLSMARLATSTRYTKLESKPLAGEQESWPGRPKPGPYIE